MDGNHDAGNEDSGRRSSMGRLAPCCFVAAAPKFTADDPMN